MYRIFCESYKNYIDSFDKDCYRLQLAKPFELIVNIDKLKKEKEKQSNLYKEMLQGMTITGLHRDDLIFLVNNNDAKIYASQGQQRLIVIAYKIAELLVFKKIKKEYPILLLDDVFSEIDIKKRNKIVKYLKSDIQVIITTTDLEDIKKKI